jgi:hypothetical protein
VERVKGISLELGSWALEYKSGKRVKTAVAKNRSALLLIFLKLILESLP